MFDSVPPNLPIAPATLPAAGTPGTNPPHPNPLPGGAREPQGSPSPIRPVPPPAPAMPSAPPPNRPIPAASSPASTPSPTSTPSTTLQQEHVTVMPSKFFIPPKERVPWKKWSLWILIAVLIGSAIVGIAWLVQQRIQPPDVSLSPVATPQTPPETPPVAPSPPVVTTPLVVTPVTPTPPPPDTSTPTPPPSTGQDVVLASAVDTDKDGLSDEEESILGTDSTVTDTDGDTYLDGIEVTNLYSPNDPDAKRRIWETTSVNKYHHPVFAYELLYPSAWVARSSGDSGQEIIFSSPSGEFVTVKVEPNPSRLSVQEWYTAQHPTASATSVAKSRSGLNGVKSSTGLVIAFPLNATAESSIVVIQYHGGPTGVSTYRTLYEMLAASLQDPQQSFWPFSSVPTPPPS